MKACILCVWVSYCNGLLPNENNKKKQNASPHTRKICGRVGFEGFAKNTTKKKKKKNRREHRIYSIGYILDKRSNGTRGARVKAHKHIIQKHLNKSQPIVRVSMLRIWCAGPYVFLLSIFHNIYLFSCILPKNSKLYFYYMDTRRVYLLLLLYCCRQKCVHCISTFLFYFIPFWHRNHYWKSEEIPWHLTNIKYMRSLRLPLI